MADYFFDASQPPPAPTANAALEMAAGDTLFLSMGVSLRMMVAGLPAITMAGGNNIAVWGTVYSATGKGLAGGGGQQILIGASGVLRAQLNAMDFSAGGNTIRNAGSISSLAGTAFAFSGGVNSVTNTGAIVAVKGIDIIGASVAADSLHLFNSGSIEVSDVAVKGTAGADVVTNTGTLRTSGNAALVDLGDGNDRYDGSLGIAIGSIVLGAGNDTAYGGAGSEIFSGGLGDDYIDGGAGIDTADYSGATNGVIVNLANTSWQTTINQGQDLLLNIENITASAFNDTLTGSAGDNVLKAGAGNDTLEGGFGTDILDGEQGDDTARYAGTASAFIDLRLTGPQHTGGYGFDTLIGIEHLEGGSGSDTLVGNDGANRLTGNNGNDTLEGGKGDDTLDGGAGGNMARFAGNRADYTWTALVTTTNPDGTTTISTTVTDNQGNQRDGVDLVKNVRLLKFADTTIALTNANPNSLALSNSSFLESTGVGTTVATLTGQDPDNDTLTYTLVSNAGGRFSLNGRSLVLNAKLDYEAATQHSIDVKVEDPYGGVLTKTLTINVGNVVETTPVVRYGTSRAETISGENGSDRLYGQAGNDLVFGNAGNDKIYGATGNDELQGGLGNDTLYGGAGKDLLVGNSGKDYFAFDARLGSSNIDTIWDFKPSDDTIYLSRSIFSKIARGTLSSNAFVVGDRVYDKYDRIIYLKSAGALFYDPDGTGPAQAVQFAFIGKNLALTSKDFVII